MLLEILVALARQRLHCFSTGIMDQTLIEAELAWSSPPPVLPPQESCTVSEISCKRKHTSSSKVNNVKKQRNGKESAENGQESVKEVEGDTRGDEMEKRGGRREKDETDPSCDDSLYQERRVIKMKGALPHLALPDGWIALNHRSGGIIYLHRPTRICSWSRPYQIGGGSVRKHDVPLAAIPCLHHKKALAKEQCMQVSSNEELAKDIRPKQGATVLNFLNASEILDSKKLDKQVSENADRVCVDSGTFPQAENSLNTIETMEADKLVGQVLVNSSKILEKPGQAYVKSGDCPQGITDDSTTVTVKIKDEEVTVTQGENLSSNGLRSGLDVIMGIDNMSDTMDSGHCPSASDHLDNEEHSRDIDQQGSSSSSIRPSRDGMKVPAVENGGDNSDSSTTGQETSSKGIDLVDAKELGSYLSNLWEFEFLTAEQEQNALIVQPQMHDTELELPASLECLPYSVKGVEIGKQGKDVLMNPGGKTPVAILHEYCQRTLKTKPVYLAFDCDNPNSPFVSEVQIEGIKYGSGTGTSKKLARQVAAEATLEVLMPGMFKKIRNYEISQDELEFFDKLEITDRKVYDLCTRANLPTPSQVLQECLKRNHGVCPSTINFRIIPGQNQNHSYKITCGKHTATGPCRNKKIGKQLASQAILQKLHPHLQKWGSLLRIYCERPSAEIKKYKKENDRSSSNTSDFSHDEMLLHKLKQEMTKLSAQMNSTSASGSSSSSSSPLPVFTVDM